MPPDTSFLKALAEAIEKLLHPYAEIVLHDLKKQTITAIYNNFSKRNVGDDCLMDSEVDLKELPDFFNPYFKTNWDGRKLKSTSITIRNGEGDAVGLFCINLDISALEEVQQTIDQFIHLKMPSFIPQDFFFDNWKEKINSLINQFLNERQITLESLSQKQKRELFAQFEEKGMFKTKQVQEYVQSVLEVGKIVSKGLFKVKE